MRQLLSGAIAYVCVVTSTSYAGVYDVSDDFSATNNPNGQWSYTGATPRVVIGLHGGALNVWASDTFTPCVLYNGTGETVTIPEGTAEYRPGEVGLHPGSNGEFSVVRWTAPTPGTVSLTARFKGLDFVGPTTTDVHISHNAVSIMDSFVEGSGSGIPFDSTLFVYAGDTIDFAVGFGRNGNHRTDTTGLSATITLTEHPAGDIDQDGDVDRVDAALFAQHFGLETDSTWQTGDFDGDGAVALSDWAILQAHFGETALPLAAPVPEPTSVLITGLGVGILVLAGCRVSRRSRELAGCRRSGQNLGVPLARLD